MFPEYISSLILINKIAGLLKSTSMCRYTPYLSMIPS
jgi:hypothetical protein